MIIPYGTHSDEDITLRIQNAREYIFVLFFVYKRYINISLATIEKPTAVYGKMTSSVILS